jgi:phosphoglycerate dehydrogenase-like enzyme
MLTLVICEGGVVDMLVVAAPPDLAASLGGPGVEVVPWDGVGTAPRPDIEVWVPAYAVGRTAHDIRSTLAWLPALRVVQLLTAGVEPWPSLLPAGVALCAGKSIHGGSTAELAVASTLALVRDLPTYAEQQARGEWKRHDPDTIAGREVLVLGAGDIGARVAATFATLDASVTLAGRTEREGVVGLDTARRMSPDVLVIALPMTDETTRLVDGEWLASLKAGAIVVNVARGPILDLEALTAEVEKGRLRAALDVTDPEPLPQEHPLWTTPGVLITPHVGGGATGWEGRARRLINDQLVRILAGDEPRFVVRHGY